MYLEKRPFMKKAKELLYLFFIFAKIGVTTFGGGYAMLPIIQRELVDNRHWATEEKLMDYYAIGQSTPGIISVNTATFVGADLYGIAGGIIATLGVIAPSILIISLISLFFFDLYQLPIVTHAFNGVSVCVCLLILDAVRKLAKSALVNRFAIIIFGFVLILSLFTEISPVLLIILAGVLGYLFSRYIEKKGI